MACVIANSRQSFEIDGTTIWEVAYGFRPLPVASANAIEADMAFGHRPLSGPRLPPQRGQATHLVVLCHGYGADGNDLIGLAPHWQRGLPTVAFVAPNAPEPCAGLAAGFQWFPISRLDPGEMQKGVESAADALNAFLDAELARLDLPPDRLALVGFSQGTMMSLHVGLRRAVKPAAIVGYSGMLARGAEMEPLAGRYAADPACPWRRRSDDPARGDVRDGRHARPCRRLRAMARCARRRSWHRSGRPGDGRRAFSAWRFAICSRRKASQVNCPVP